MIPEILSNCKEVMPPWWQWHPPVGIFIALLAVLGVLVPWFRGNEIGKGERAFWTFLMFSFVGLEIRTIYLDQAQHEREQAFARCQQLESFQNIANRIEQAIDQSQLEFNATMKRSDKVLALQGRELSEIAKTIDTFTGSESYACLTDVPNQGFLAFTHEGDYPLYGVSARIVDLDQMPQNLIGVTISVGDMIKSHVVMRQIPYGIPLEGDHFNANIFFNARNGDWVEKFRARKTRDGWGRAIRVEGMFTTLKKGKPMCETVDRQFQLDSDGKVEKDWTPDSKLPRCE